MPDESKDISGNAGNPQKDAGTATKKVLSPTMNKGPFIPRVPKFEGKCVDLKGHIYDCSDVRQSDQFTKTT